MISAHKTMSSTEWLMLVTLSVLWGGSFFFIGVALAELPPFTIVALRVSLASAVLMAVVLFTGKKLIFTNSLFAIFMIMGVLNNVIPFSLIVWGQTSIASGLAAILNATTPIFGVIFAHFCTEDEKISPEKIVGVTLGFTGVTYMIGFDLFTNIGSHIAAQMAVLAAAISYGFAGVYGRRFKKMGVDPLVTSTGQLIASSVVLIPLAFFVETPWRLVLPSFEVWFAITGLAIFSTALAYIIYFRILATAGATNVLLVTLLIPVSAVLLGWLFLEEHLRVQHIIGMVLIGSGLIVIDGRILRFLSILLQARKVYIKKC